MTFNIADAIYGEPLSILVQEALAKIGITVEINRVPASQYGQMMDDKQVPLFFERSSSLLRFPDYAYHIFFSQEWRWNFGSLRSEEMDQLIADAAIETDSAKYDAMARRMAEIAAEQVPVIMLWLPPIGMVTRQEVEGYTYAMHQGPDFRTFTQA
jgi:peptide/nickel transport system substrate-binding protein